MFGNNPLPPGRRLVQMATAAVAMAIALCSGLWRATEAKAAFAGSTISMTASIGFSGYYSENYWIPAYVEVHNQGALTSGVLSIALAGDVGQGRVQNGKLTWHVTIPTGWHQYTIAVPGNLLGATSAPELDMTTPHALVQPTYLNGNRIENTDLIAVLSTEANNAQFLTGTTGPPSGNPVLPIALNPANLPDKPDLFDTLTAVVTTPETLVELTGAQQSALWSWVRMGGMLFVTGVHWGTSSPPLPIVAGPPKWISGQPLAAFIHGPDTKSWTLLMEGQGIRTGAKVVVGSAGNPLVASMRIGRGQLVQTSFDPTQSRLLQWAGNVSLWTSLLKSMDSGNLAVDRTLLDKNGLFTLTTASDGLSPLRIPSLRFWGIVFGIYILLIGPVVFLLLRRFRRQSLAWVILPTLSIVTTMSIYLFGESERPTGTLTEGVAMLDLIGDSRAESYGVSAFMSPSILTASATIAEPMLLLPLAEQGIRHVGQATVVHQGNGSKIGFQNVGRFDVRYIYAAGFLTGQGEFRTSLESTYNFTGTITNHTKYPMHDVAILWNNKIFPVGNMVPGQTKQLNFSESTPDVSDSWLLAYSNYNRDVARGIGRSLGNYSEPLVNVSLDQHTALIIATTNSRVPTLPLLNGLHYASSDTLTLVRQFVSVADYPLG